MGAHDWQRAYQVTSAKGWILDRIQDILVREDKTLSVPVHGNSDLKKGTLNALMKQGGLK
jgi:predicted RNA binding protein YcfA (HicA-like mRNA interferase family)